MRLLPHSAGQDAASAEKASEFEAEVTDFRELGRQEGARLFQVALTSSPFTPQRCHGFLVATSRTGHTLEAEVLAVEEGAEGVLWHTTRKPLQPGVVVQGRLFRCDSTLD